MVTKPAWKTAELDPRKVLLDVRNPRIEVEADAIEGQILLKLLDFEDVLELARNIEKNGGLFKGERIITVVENGKHVVLEGNRRVAASKMLLDPKLVPSPYKMRFPVASAATKTALRKLSSDVSPDRETAEPILTKRHTERGVKPWAPVAKMRRAVRLLEHMSVDQVAQMLGTSPSQVKKLVRPYRLLKYAINLKGWNEHERKALEDEKLKTNPYTRFFTLSKTKESLQYHFDDDENIVSALPQKVFKDQMTRIARDFLIPDPGTGRTRCDTRTSPDQYFSAFLNSPEGKPPQAVPPGKGATENPGSGGKNSPGDKTSTGDKPPPGNTKPATPKASVFFENLQCHVQDDNLIKLTDEIRRVDHVRMTISASLLTRAIFECAIVYKIKAAKKWGELIREDGKDPGLAELIKFSGNFANGVFIENNICKALRSHTTVQAKNYLDAMTHLKYQNADAPTLQSVANNLRQIIQYILAGN